jgi:hypothetical protein
MCFRFIAADMDSYIQRPEWSHPLIPFEFFALTLALDPLTASSAALEAELAEQEQAFTDRQTLVQLLQHALNPPNQSIDLIWFLLCSVLVSSSCDRIAEQQQRQQQAEQERVEAKAAAAAAKQEAALAAEARARVDLAREDLTLSSARDIQARYDAKTQQQQQLLLQSFDLANLKPEPPLSARSDHSDDSMATYMSSSSSSSLMTSHPNAKSIGSIANSKSSVPLQQHGQGQTQTSAQAQEMLLRVETLRQRVLSLVDQVDTSLNKQMQRHDPRILQTPAAQQGVMRSAVAAARSMRSIGQMAEAPATLRYPCRLPNTFLTILLAILIFSFLLSRPMIDACACVLLLSLLWLTQ